MDSGVSMSVTILDDRPARLSFAIALAVVFAVGVVGLGALGPMRVHLPSGIPAAVHAPDAGAGASQKGLPTARLIALFDAERAHKHVHHLSHTMGRRPPGSSEERLAADYIEAELKGWGWDTLRQDSIPVSGTALKTQNVSATHATDSGRSVVIVGAHYDSSGLPAPSRGASDNGSGVGVVLELARVMRHANLPYELRLVFFGGEEAGKESPGTHHTGSMYYLDRLGEDQRANVLAMVSVDMVGAGSTLCASRVGYGSDRARQCLLASAERLQLDVKTNSGTNRSDHEAFESAGIPAVWLTRLVRDPRRQTTGDTAGQVRKQALVESGRLVVRFLMMNAERHTARACALAAVG